MKILCLIFCLLLVACSTGGAVVQMSSDTYLVANEGYGSSGSSQKSKAIKTANRHCEKMGKTLKVISTNQNEGGFGSLPSAEVVFSCED